MSYGPLSLPKPKDLFAPGGMPIRQTQLDQPPVPKVQDPQYAFPKQEMQVPDVVAVRYGAGDKAIVGKLLKAVKGEESGLTGISSTYAAKMLQSWGYPTEPNAWTADQWKQGIDANAGMTNPMALLGGY